MRFGLCMPCVCWSWQPLIVLLISGQRFLADVDKLSLTFLFLSPLSPFALWYPYFSLSLSWFPCSSLTSSPLLSLSLICPFLICLSSLCIFFCPFLHRHPLVFRPVLVYRVLCFASSSSRPVFVMPLLTSAGCLLTPVFFELCLFYIWFVLCLCITLWFSFCHTFPLLTYFSPVFPFLLFAFPCHSSTPLFHFQSFILPYPLSFSLESAITFPCFPLSSSAHFLGFTLTLSLLLILCFTCYSPCHSAYIYILLYVFYLCLLRLSFFLLRPDAEWNVLY